MRNLEIEQTMYEMATTFLKQRFPKGWGGVAVIHTEQGSYFTSVALESANASVLLCIEAGAMCEAHKYQEKVTHCLCVVRENENAPFCVLSPCGVCQERLRYWGEDVQVGVTSLQQTARSSLCRFGNCSPTTGAQPTPPKSWNTTRHRPALELGFGRLPAAHRNKLAGADAHIGPLGSETEAVQQPPEPGALLPGPR